MEAHETFRAPRSVPESHGSRSRHVERRTESARSGVSKTGRCKPAKTRTEAKTETTPLNHRDNSSTIQRTAVASIRISQNTRIFLTIRSDRSIDARTATDSVWGPAKAYPQLHRSAVGRTALLHEGHFISTEDIRHQRGTPRFPPALSLRRLPHVLSPPSRSTRHTSTACL